jgi:YHS domain-containing protein
MCVALAMLALGVLGCQQAQETVAEQAETMTEESTAVMEEGAEAVMEELPLVDPVCGMEVTMESEWTAEYEGVTFYFCSEACRDAFIKEPGKYLEAAGEEVLPT